jgi:glycosyltransferase involved in cell wall biosynthesis
MSPPFFSIILATFNRAHLLPRALQSVVAQDFQDWELIVVDDGSTDETLRLMEPYPQREARIHLIQKEHSGLSRTRNAGIEKAKGLYTCFLDSDDEWKANHLSLHHQYLEKNSRLDFLHGKVEIIGNPFVPDREDPARTIHLEDCPAIGGSLFIRTSLLRNVGGFPVVDFSEDRALYDLLIDRGARHEAVEFRTYRYHRDEPDAICNQYRKSL